MKLDFDTDIVRKNKIELLDCQVDLILRSLEFYAYTYQFIYPRCGKSESKEENLRICLVRDTYEQIMSELDICVSQINSGVFDDDKKFFEKIS